MVEDDNDCRNKCFHDRAQGTWYSYRHTTTMKWKGPSLLHSSRKSDLLECYKSDTHREGNINSCHLSKLNIILSPSPHVTT